jgi:Polyketide cyclase / dehydrase and lipid transport
MTADYHFVTVWRVPGSTREVADILGDAEALPRWWPSVYIDVSEVSPGGADGRGRVVDLLTKGWLPYTLRWTLTAIEPVTEEGFSIRAGGDFVGSGRWTFVQEGPEVEVTYDWRIRVEKPLLIQFTPVLRPAFAANHRWAMARGEESLKLELRRRRGSSAVPDPPSPTFRWLRRSRVSGSARTG